MIDIICKFVITKDDTQALIRKKYGLVCGIVGIFFNILLSILKVTIGVIFSSIAVIADAINNLSDAMSSIVTVIGFKISSKQADKEHPYGHGRAEYISALVVAISIILAGVELLKTSLQNLIDGNINRFENIYIYIFLTLSILIKLYMYLYNKNIGNKIESQTLKATAKDSISDVVATSAVLISLFLTKYITINLDAISGIFVSLFIIFQGIMTCKETLNPLIGSNHNNELESKICKIAISNEKIIGIHDLAIHDYGPTNLIITFHAEVRATENLISIHEVIDSIERKIKEELGFTATIHIDPVDLESPKTLEYMERITNMIKENISIEAEIHDFRLVDTSNETKIFFDVVIPYNRELLDDEIKMKVEEIVKSIDSKSTLEINIDRK